MYTDALDATKKDETKQEIIDVVSQTFAQSDGISIDAIEQAINAKIDEISGKHWDFANNRPEKRVKIGRWEKDLGEILSAYYAWEDAKVKFQKIAEQEELVDKTAENYKKSEFDLRKAQEDYKDFDNYAPILENYKWRNQNIEILKKELKKEKDVLLNWPKYNNALEQANSLKNEKDAWETKDKYNEAKKIVDEITAKNNEIADKKYPDEKDIKKVKDLQREIDKLKSKLGGMNLTAAVRMFNDNTLKVTSCVSGEKINVSDDKFSITEAVNITIPDVMEMQLSPFGVDVKAIESDIEEKEESVKHIFGMYNVADLEELENLKKFIDNAVSIITSNEEKLKLILSGIDFAELEAKVNNSTIAVRTKDEIDQNIKEVCGSDEIISFKGKMEGRIEDYSKIYIDIGKLGEKVKETENQLEKAESESGYSIEDIPVQYRDVTDIKEYREKLKDKVDKFQEKRDNAYDDKTKAEIELAKYGENSAGDLKEKVEESEQKFNETKSLLEHWKHIQEVFNEQKEKLKSNPMQDIADSFAQYLEIISEGKVSSEFPEANNINMNIYSDNRKLDYKKLSEGTKETVFLAFRLAVLDHLFPDGGGIIIFDDPFTDMDAERTIQACELVKECAKRHQVLFFTCKQEYAEMLNCPEIRI